MPNKNGYEVLEELYNLGIRANIYLLTADGDNDTIQKAKEYNVGYLAKPISISVIKSIILNFGGGG